MSIMPTDLNSDDSQSQSSLLKNKVQQRSFLFAKMQMHHFINNCSYSVCGLQLTIESCTLSTYDHFWSIFERWSSFSQRLTFADAALCECAEGSVLVCVEHSIEQSELE